MDKKYYTTKEVKDILNVSNTTLMRYRNEDIVKYVKLSEKKFLYDRESIDNLVSNTNINNDFETDNRINVIYSRVSTSKQQDDLLKQKQLLNDYCNTNGIIVSEVFSEVASGMNEDRKELNKMLKMVCEKKVDKIYITYKDRLTRFGFGYIKNICDLYGTEIIILNNKVNESSFEEELSQDLVSIIHHFSMKMYGKRRSNLNKIKKELAESNKK